MAATEIASPVSDQAIKDAIVEILKGSDLGNTTEFKVRKLASEKLNIDLNTSAHKKLVRKVVEDYLSSKAAGAAEEEEIDAKVEGFGEAQIHGQPVENDSDEDEEKHKSRRAPPTEQIKKASFNGDNDDQLVCELSSKRNVSIQKFRGKTLISIREYYEKDGELRPSAKGISLSVDQWNILKSKVSAIENAIAELRS